MIHMKLMPVGLAALLAAASASNAATLLSEEFSDVYALPAAGWVFTNASVSNGLVAGWSQGDQTVLTAPTGAAESFAASNYNVAAAGGIISNWLITPAFSTAYAGTVTFWAAAAIDPGFSDMIAFGLSGTGNSVPGSFTLNALQTVGGNWTQYSLNFAAAGAGSVARLAIVHAGLADTSNYVGIDALTITNLAPVPEPGSWMLLGGGLAVLGLARRRGARK